MSSAWARVQDKRPPKSTTPAAAPQQPAADEPGSPSLDMLQSAYDRPDSSYSEEVMLSIVVVGASGDLAKKKIFPALFALYYQGLLPRHVQIVGYARSAATDAEFRDKIFGTLACRVDAGCCLLYTSPSPRD